MEAKAGIPLIARHGSHLCPRHVPCMLTDSHAGAIKFYVSKHDRRLMPNSIVDNSAKRPIVYRPAHREEASDPYKRTLQLDDVTDGGLG